MPKITKVKIEDLVAASQKYATAQVKKANANKDGTLSKTEAKALAKDLQDNFAASQFKLPSGSVKTTDMVREFTVMMEAWAKASDKNHDGYLSITETRALPKTLRDNVIDYIGSLDKTVSNSGGLSTRDITQPSNLAAWNKKYGTGGVTYEQAFAKALKAVATDSESGLPAFVSEFGGPDGEGETDPKKLAAEVKQLLANGTMGLVDVDEELPTGETSKDGWIFSVQTNGQGDNGLWAIVDRKTGDVTVTNFN